MKNPASNIPSKGPFAYENWLAAQSGMPVQVTYEYPLFTDAHITGHITEGLGPYQLLNTVPMESLRHSRPTLVLRVGYHLLYDPTEAMTKTDDESSHGGLLSDEIAALASLCMGIRLKAGGETRIFDIDDDPKGRPAAWTSIPDPILPTVSRRIVLPRIIGTHSLDHTLLIATLPRLTAKDAVALVRAARLYEDAVWMAETTPELSWIMLASAVETVASRWREVEEEPLARLRLSRPQLEELLRSQGDEEFVRRVAEEIAPYMGATKTFIDFILTFLPPAPSERPNEFARLKWEASSMKKVLKKIYSYRSRALHGGVPFPAPMSSPPRAIGDSDIPVEIPFGMASRTRGGTWLAQDIPMLLHTFEYIVRNALVNWWRSAANAS
jgi:hypothetical protein